MSSRHTIGSGIGQGAGQWEVFRLRTQNSVYLLGLHRDQGRRVAVLRGEPGTAKADLAERGADPRVGDASLWEVPRAQWVGAPLDVAGVRTSPLVGVEAVADPHLRHTVTHELPAPSSMAMKVTTGQPWRDPTPSRAIYPECYVEHAEDAATLQRAVARKPPPRERSPQALTQQQNPPRMRAERGHGEAVREGWEMNVFDQQSGNRSKGALLWAAPRQDPSA